MGLPLLLLLLLLLLLFHQGEARVVEVPLPPTPGDVHHELSRLERRKREREEMASSSRYEEIPFMVPSRLASEFPLPSYTTTTTTPSPQVLMDYWKAKAKEKYPVPRPTTTLSGNSSATTGSQATATSSTTSRIIEVVSLLDTLRDLVALIRKTVLEGRDPLTDDEEGVNIQVAIDAVYR